MNSIMIETKTMTIARVINNCMIAFGIVLLSQGVYTNSTYKTMLKDLIICLDVVIMHFVLVYLRSFISFTLGGLGLIFLNYLFAIPQAAAGNYDYIPVFVVAIGVLLLAYYSHLNEVVMIKPSNWMLIFCVAYLFLATFLKADIPLQFGELYTICIIVFSFIYIVLYRQDRRLRLSSDRTYVPAQRIRSSNFMLMSIGSGMVFFVGIVFLVIGHGEKLINAIWNVILSILKFLFGGVRYDMASESSSSDVQIGSKISFGDFVEQKENPFLDKLWEILTYVMSFAAAGLCIYLVVALAISFYKRFQQTAKVREKDKVEYLKPDETITLTKKAESSHIKFGDRSPAARIRRKYKKFIKKSPGYSDVEEQMTPEEIENAAYKNDNYENKKLIHEMYEKARYGGSDISGKDVAVYEKLF